MERDEMRRTRKLRPLAEHLEGRQLLNGDVLGPGGRQINQKDLDALLVKRANGVPLSGRRLEYTTPQGAMVTISLYGAGNLEGSAVRPDGTLDLVYNNTNQASGIVANVKGGNAKLGSMRDADVSFDNLSGVGGNLVRVVNLKGFDLIDGGKVNLTGGVNSVFLNSVGANTQVNLREIPYALIEPNGNPSTAADPTTVTQNGRTLNFVDQPNGGRFLASVSGQFAAGPSLENALKPGADTPVAPAGISLNINDVNGGPNGGTLQSAQVFGYDPADNQLIRFDTGTGQALQTINLPGATPATGSAGVGLSRVNGRLTALVGVGSSVYAYDALTGNAAGSFSIAGLAASGLTAVDGIGSTETRTILIDAGNGAGGVAQIIDVSASLSSGQAVAVGTPYEPTRGFELAGGVGSVAGSNTIYATGAAHFDSFQPNTLQPGFLTLSGAGNRLTELARNQLNSPQSVSTLNIAPGSTDGVPLKGLGSVEANLALVTGQSDGTNTVTLYAPGSFARTGSITLNESNPLTGLSSTFHPELVDSALIDIQGNVQSVRINNARGMVLNDAGNLNYVQIRNASNSTVIGQPLTHLNITRRSNVTVRSNARSAGMRGDVIVNSGQAQVGPLSLPNA